MISETLRRFHSAVERESEIVREFHGLVARDQGGDRDDAAVPRRQTWPFPEIAYNNGLAVLFESGRDRPKVFGHRHRS